MNAMKNTLAAFVLMLSIFSAVGLGAQELSQNAQHALAAYQLAVEQGISGEDREDAALHAIETLGLEAQQATNPAEAAELLGHIAIIYQDLIVDGRSWLRFDSKRTEAINSAEEANPDNRMGRIARARGYLLLPPEAGGDAELGLELMTALHGEFPDSLLIDLSLADFFKSMGDGTSALEYYQAVLQLDDSNTYASEAIADIELAEDGRRIERIEFSGEYTSNQRALDRAVAGFLGSQYTLETKTQVGQALSALPSVARADVSATIDSSNALTLSISLQEESMKVWGVFIDGGVSTTYDNSLTGNGTPLAMYINNNVQGSGNQLTIMFAGVYAYLGLDIPQRPGLALDLGLYADVMAISEEYLSYVDGEEQDWVYKSPSVNAGLSLAKALALGMELSLDNTITLEDFSAEGDNFSAPENAITISNSLALGYSPASNQLPSVFYPSNGLTLEAVGTLVYQLDYESWGPASAPYNHNDKPALMTSYRLGYSAPIGDVVSLGAVFSYLRGYNSYHRSKWLIGQGSAIEGGPSISGYYSDEFQTDNAALLNATANFMIIPDRLALIANHDLLYHGEQERLYQGSALGVSLVLPRGMELNGQFAMGWNADRQAGHSWALNFTMVKFFVK